VPNLFTHPPRLPLVAPSILSADFADLGADCAHILDPSAGGADLLHVDIMDGHFVHNLTMGPALVRSLRKALPGAFLDVHLMVTDPGQYLEPFAEAGANHLTFHIEPVLDPRAGTGLSPLSAGYDPVELAERIRHRGLTAGLAVNPPTDVETVLPFIEHFDLILVMSVNPGFSGQSFIPEVLAKTRVISERLEPHQRLEMDGGIGPDTARDCREAGCDVLVSASALFGKPRAQRGQIVKALKSS